MLKNLSLLIVCAALQFNALAQTEPGGANGLADQALAKARAGQNQEAISLYQQALAADPENLSTLRDYAVVLGWNEQYRDAIAVIKKIRSVQNDQPVWALREFARSYLFGDDTQGALSILNELVEKQDVSETTLTRRALALRWLGRKEEALQAYRETLKAHPDSADAAIGIAYCLADKNKLAEALQFLNSTAGVDTGSIQIIKAKIRILNWMGRHYEAQRLLTTIPEEHNDDRDILEDRVAAARWGGKPVEAANDVMRLSSLFPGQSTSELSRNVLLDFGHSVMPSIRYIEDSDGLIDRTAALDASFHVNPAHALRAGYQYRILQQPGVESWRRYDLGWTGTLHRKVTMYATVSGLDYQKPAASQRFIGDASVTISPNDKVRFSIGGGSIMVDAYNAIQKQVTAPFGYAEAAAGSSASTLLQVRYSRYNFTDGVTRDRADGELMHSMLPESRLKLNLGWRSNLMWHNAQTDDFYSPLRFQSHLAVIQSGGRLASWLDYWGEVAAGWQAEAMAPVLHPLQLGGKLLWHPSQRWGAVLEAGRSTSSLDRPSAGLRTYKREVVSAEVQFRFR